MNITLHPEWKAILTRAWSVRFLALAGLFETVGAVAQALVDQGALSITLHILAAASTAAAGVTRVLAQSNMPENT